MKVYVVENNNRCVLAVFQTKRRAQSFVKRVGQKLWNEDWRIWPMDINKVEPWILNDYPKDITCRPFT